MDRQEHLNEVELAFYVDALRLRRVEGLPAEILGHVQGCMECKIAIMEVSSVVPDDVYSGEEGHSFSDKRRLWDRLKEDSTTFLRIAASVALVITFGAILYFIVFRSTNQTLDISRTKPLHTGRN